MSTARVFSFFVAQQAFRNSLVAIAFLGALAPLAVAQTEGHTAATTEAMLALPNAPGTPVDTPTTNEPATSEATTSSSLDPGDADDPRATSTPKHAPHLQMVIAPGEVADPMTVQDKVVGGLKDSFSLFSAIGWLTSAGWEQIWNSSPNYGTDSGAFGQRLGAATLRASSEGVFSESLFAPIFHEDPRYYVMGPGHPFFKRLVYAGTRVLITRTDSGHATPNFALLAGNAAGSALTIPYYPKINTTGSQVALTFGTSLGGSALGYVVNEFIVDALIDLHLKKKQ